MEDQTIKSIEELGFKLNGAGGLIIAKRSMEAKK